MLTLRKIDCKFSHQIILNGKYKGTIFSDELNNGIHNKCISKGFFRYILMLANISEKTVMKYIFNQIDINSD